QGRGPFPLTSRAAHRQPGLRPDGARGGQEPEPRVYGRVGDLFRDRFGERAGWAHSLLFVAELPSFRPVLPPDVVGEMDEWREREQAAKREEKAKKKKKRAGLEA
ncbi:hypothetical protein THAOC_33555, partial [Thalassiosira oceanica]